MNLTKLTSIIAFCSAICGASAMPVPTFKETGTDGKIYTAHSLTSGKPVLLMFLEAGCPHSPRGIKMLNDLQKSTRGKIRIIGMVNLGAAQAKTFAKKYHAAFPILADQNGKTIAKFGAQACLDNALVYGNHGMIHLWKGYNQATLRRLEAELAKNHGPNLHLSLAKYPKDLQSGCMFGEAMGGMQP